MLGLTALLGVFFVAYVVYLQSSVLMETRRHTKEMQAQRDLADKAEASRFTELRNFLEAQENAHMARNAERHAALLARVEQLETAIRLRVRPDRTTRWRRTSASWKTASIAALGGRPQPACRRRSEPTLLRSQHPGRELLRVGLVDLVLAGMGTGPQTPEPPFMILVASRSTAPLSSLYLAATSLKAGPSTFGRPHGSSCSSSTWPAPGRPGRARRSRAPSS